MKEIFDIHRFGAFAFKYYCENLKTILIFVGVMIIVTFLTVCMFNPFQSEYLGFSTQFTKEDFIWHYEERFALFFWILLGIFSIIAASYSFVDVMSRRKANSALLLPASTFEKFLLGILNSTVLVLLLHFAIFYGSANVACSYKYGGLEEMNFTKSSVLNIQVPLLKPGQEIVRPKVGNVFYFVNKFSASKTYLMENERGELVEVKNEAYITPFLSWNLLIISWLYFVGLFLWGAITFRKLSALLTILLHGLFFLLVGFITYRIGETCFRGPREESMLYGLYFLNTDSKMASPPPALLLMLLYVFPITYIGVIWKKFKNKQV